MNMKILAPISVGELLDKITILQLKLSYATTTTQAHNCQHELQQLQSIMPEIPDHVQHLFEQLHTVNHMIWNLEQEIRQLSEAQQLNHRFIWVATQIHVQNDHRASIKRDINRIMQSDIQEEKVYAS
jgi:predicted  nucleic acid-binding Zn-ribbon protein